MRDGQPSQPCPLASLPAKIAAPVKEIRVPLVYEGVAQPPVGGVVEWNPAGPIGDTDDNPLPPV